MSRVENHERLGLNVSKKIAVVPKKKGKETPYCVDKGKTIMAKHKRFIADLNKKKQEDRELKNSELEEMKLRDKSVGFG